jgi:hypothetical protein
MALKKKDKYRTRNWNEYSQSLVNRGSITFWFNEDSIAKWHSVERTGRPGRPDTYSDDAIRCGLMIKAVFRIALRALQGFVESLINILGLELICPHYSVFSRRAKDLQIPLRKLLKPGENLNVIFDSTGIKVFGEGEWKVRKHGYSKRRTWSKVHVGMCADSGQVVVSAVTSNSVSDDEAMIYMMESLWEISSATEPMIRPTAGRPFMIEAGERSSHQTKMRNYRRKNHSRVLKARDEAIRRIQELGDEGRALWKQEVGYHRRSRVETLMFRFKTILGDRLASRRESTQATEVVIKLDVLNRMTELGRPKNYKVAY